MSSVYANPGERAAALDRRAGPHRRTALTLRAPGYRYKEIQQLLGVTYTWVNRHVTEGRQALRRAEATADAEVEAAVREAAS
jgi:DNA-directed RNA polymerase specialized sigma24 family protein